MTHVIHYVDDYLCGGAASPSGECARSVELIVRWFGELGIPINASKFAAEATPSTTTRFLGIVLDTRAMTARLDDERLAAIKLSLEQWSVRQRATTKELQSLIGVLSFAAKVVTAGRTFLRRMLALLAATSKNVKAGDSFALGVGFRADLLWWRRFVADWNGVSVLHDPFWCAPSRPVPHSAPIRHLFTDASSEGYGAVFGAEWFAGLWSSKQLASAYRVKDISMPYLELLSVALAVSTWGPVMRGLRMVVHSDCKPAVFAFESQSVQNAHLMCLVRDILFLAARHEFALRLEHLPVLRTRLLMLCPGGRFQSSKLRTRDTTLRPQPLCRCRSRPGNARPTPGVRRAGPQLSTHVLHRSALVPGVLRAPRHSAPSPGAAHRCVYVDGLSRLALPPASPPAPVHYR